MRHVIRVLFVIAFFVLNICLITPMVNRGMSWQEAGLGIAPSAFVALICFALMLAGVGTQGRSRSRAMSLWAAALLWSLVLGGIITFSTTSSYQSNISSTTRSSSERSSYSSLDDAYSRDDEIGTMFGWATLGFAGVSFFGLIISLVIRKKTPDNLGS